MQFVLTHLNMFGGHWSWLTNVYHFRWRSYSRGIRTWSVSRLRTVSARAALSWQNKRSQPSYRTVSMTSHFLRSVHTWHQITCYSVSIVLTSLTYMWTNLMVFSHWARTRPIPREIVRPIKMAYIELYGGVHTAPRQYHWCHWLTHFIGLVISLGVIQCEHTIKGVRLHVAFFRPVFVSGKFDLFNVTCKQHYGNKLNPF